MIYFSLSLSLYIYFSNIFAMAAGLCPQCALSAGIHACRLCGQSFCDACTDILLDQHNGNPRVCIACARLVTSDEELPAEAAGGGAGRPRPLHRLLEKTTTRVATSTCTRRGGASKLQNSESTRVERSYAPRPVQGQPCPRRVLKRSLKVSSSTCIEADVSGNFQGLDSPDP